MTHIYTCTRTYALLACKVPASSAMCTGNLRIMTKYDVYLLLIFTHATHTKPTDAKRGERIPAINSSGVILTVEQ